MLSILAPESALPPSVVGQAFAFDEKGRLDLAKVTEDVERRAIEEALRRTGGVISEAARVLNVTRRILSYKMDKLGIASKQGDEEAGKDGPDAA